MIIVIANVGLLPFELVKRELYHRQEGRFFDSARAQLNARHFYRPGDNRGAEFARLRWRVHFLRDKLQDSRLKFFSQQTVNTYTVRRGGIERRAD